MSPEAVVYGLAGTKKGSQGADRGEVIRLTNKTLWSFPAFSCLFLMLELSEKDPGWLLRRSPNITKSKK